MLNPSLHLNSNLYQTDVECKSVRTGFGEGLLFVGEQNSQVVVLCTDLTSSTRVDLFAKKFPERFVQTGIAEQNMISIASGLAISRKIPFAVSHAIFSPSRNWDQIRMSVCLSNTNVKIVGTHLGFSNGKDGAVAESLEDIALMRVLPRMIILQPVDAIEAKKAVIAVTEYQGPVYLRISKEETPLITTEETPFEIGKAYVLMEGKDLTIISSGPITHEALLAAKDLKARYNIEVEIISCTTIKPLDEATILKSVKKTGKVVTLEEHQIIGGLGSAVAELLSGKYPTKLLRIGMKDSFGESGDYKELKDKYGLSSHNIVKEVINFIKGL
jgi:transketolase